MIAIDDEARGSCKTAARNYKLTSKQSYCTRVWDLGSKKIRCLVAVSAFCDVSLDLLTAGPELSPTRLALLIRTNQP
jgi:hypothetical protein